VNPNEWLKKLVNSLLTHAKQAEGMASLQGECSQATIAAYLSKSLFTATQTEEPRRLAANEEASTMASIIKEDATDIQRAKTQTFDPKQFEDELIDQIIMPYRSYKQS